MCSVRGAKPAARSTSGPSIATRWRQSEASCWGCAAHGAVVVRRCRGSLACTRCRRVLLTVRKPVPDRRGRHSVRTLAWGRRTRHRQVTETDLKLEIRLNGEPRAGETFEFAVSSTRRVARVAAYIGQSRVCEVSSVDPPHSQTVQIPPDAAGLTLRIRAVDTIGNNIEEQRTIGARVTGRRQQHSLVSAPSTQRHRTISGRSEAALNTPSGETPA